MLWPWAGAGEVKGTKTVRMLGVTVCGQLSCAACVLHSYSPNGTGVLLPSPSLLARSKCTGALPTDVLAF